MIETIELFLKLINKGIALLREGQRQRKLFFEDVVKPTHEVFEKLYNDHLKTFEATRAMLLDLQSTPRSIQSYVQGQILFQHGTTVLLRQLTEIDEEEEDWRRLPGGELGARFGSYIVCVARCLRSPREYPSLAYYDALDDVISRLSSESNLSPHEREQVIGVLERVVRKLHDFHAEVYEQYIGLQRYCST